MASRYEVEVNLSSAKGLKNVNWRHGPNRPYAVVWVDPKSKCSSRVDESGDTEANWDQTLVIPLPPGPIEDFTLYIDVVHAGSEEDTKPLIGSAKLKLSEVLEDIGMGVPASQSLKLKRPSGRPQGKVEVKVTVRQQGYRGYGSYDAPPYGVPPPSASRDYSGAPPAYGYQYGAPQPAYGAAPPSGYPYGGSGYGAPPIPAPYGQPNYGYNQGGQGNYGYNQGYGYDQGGYGAVEEKKKSKFGMGTGLAVGAVAGAVGGIALVEGAEYLEDKIADDAAEKVEEDLGYDDE
ncbi:hypothetical protein L6164_006021 [Bauhinia variegata]|uniref:Uncharacterized protein n=1 Tax=Bauhinia variegata TaxID=167791 RepID=A0ACB9PSE1_BAUVA|nr:hypothetical protein L6164_006021 [Bauhinia variegata]